MIRRIGCRAHDYGRASIEELTSKMSGDGYKTTQLALKKALTNELHLGPKAEMKSISHIKEIMTMANMDIGVLGAYLNYAHPDSRIRQTNIEQLKQHLQIATSIGARMVGTETGSLNPDYKVHKDNHGPEAYLRFKEAIEEVMPIAGQMNTYMAVEAVAHHIIHGPSSMIQLIKGINNPRLKVIFDINNMMTYENVHKQEMMIHQMFDALEDQIWAVHVKDFDFVDGEKVIVPLGQGLLQLDVLMARVKKSGEEIDVLAENIQRERLTETATILSAYSQSEVH